MAVDDLVEVALDVCVELPVVVIVDVKVVLGVVKVQSSPKNAVPSTHAFRVRSKASMNVSQLVNKINPPGVHDKSPTT